jgi:glycosyltransferase involved in cell wall biosynthesis
MMSDKKNILIIPGMIPYPPTDGGRLCTFGLIGYLRKYNNIHILLYAHDECDKNNIQILINLWPDVVIHYVDASATVLKLSKFKQFERVVKNKLRPIYKLLKGDKTDIQLNLYSEYESSRSMPFFPHGSPFIEKMESIIATNNFDIIQTETVEFINLVNVFPDDVKKVFLQLEDRSDILYDYGISHNFNPGYVKYIAGNAAFIEHAFMNKYNAVLVLNETDRIKTQLNVAPNIKVYTSPFGLLDADFKNPAIDTFVPENLILIGGEGHYPNLDALDWFLKDTIPKFEQIPFKKIFISGVWSEATCSKYHRISNYVQFIGFVDDLTPYFSTSVSIVPIRIGGGGIRTKTLYSMAHGSPVISTSLAAVGITGNHQQELLIADTAADFADSISTLFTNLQLARNIAKNAYKMVTEKYNQSHVGAIRHNIYQEITSDEPISN